MSINIKNKSIPHRLLQVCTCVCSRSLVAKGPLAAPDEERENRVFARVMPTPVLCRVVDPRTQRFGGSPFRLARIVGIIREFPERRRTDMEVCSGSACK
ncbi:hypothetical protein E2553_33355 [Paraburkholderia dipogonis]|uniref:Uncharacterized protein n=1 Tax=Paraburkholderia dipogonis TaxID=1211383 RepID=A0A4Y8MVS7_9BURK|nr:hypothetical protein E2553_33355 [Paraburkholderia dipogonis]